MRKIVKAGIIAAGLGLVFSMAAAAAPDEQTPETRAYLSFSFGGEKSGVHALHYGLRLDHDRYFVPNGQAVPPLMQLDFSRRGLSAMQVNGLNVLRPAYRMSQAEEGAEEVAAEEEGFFESIGNWFSDLFGDDEEEETVAEAASDAAVPAEAEEAAAESTFLGYGVVDWSLVAVGVAGIVFIGTEVADGEDDPNPKAAAPPAEEGPDCPDLDPACIPGLPLRAKHVEAGVLITPEHQEWLDSGTGQMGDLH